MSPQTLWLFSIRMRSLLLSLILSRPIAHGSSSLEQFLGLGFKKLAHLPFCLLACSLLEVSHHAVRKPKTHCGEAPGRRNQSQNHLASWVWVIFWIKYSKARLKPLADAVQRTRSFRILLQLFILDAKKKRLLFQVTGWEVSYIIINQSVAPEKENAAGAFSFGILDSIKNKSPAFSFKVRVTLWLSGEHTRKTVLKTESLDSGLHEASKNLLVLCEPQFHYL